jgi:hypothetical protein
VVNRQCVRLILCEKDLWIIPTHRYQPTAP